jgi:2-polyprenyl-3-methyl-5-hydroxy-6-metoxy-1,4-benzoquinol methylase
MDVKCISCGNSSHYQFHTVKEMMYGLREKFTYSECLECGCLQIADIPYSLEKYYSNKYYSLKKSDEKNPVHKIISLLEKKRNRYSLFHKGILGKYLSIKYNYLEGDILWKLGIRKNWYILDIGCGTGLWLFSLSKLGFTNLYGIDPFIDTDINENPVNIKKETIYDLHNSRKFDLIRSYHSFEHIPDQYETLITIRKLLAPKGIFIIAMPIKTETIWRKYGTNWAQLDAPRHLIIHTVSSFEILSRKAGFEISDVIFNSTAFQFWGSEQYMKDIPLKSEKSYLVSHYNSMFSKEMIQYYCHESKRLNRESQGDQAIFVLKPIPLQKYQNKHVNL